MKTTAASVFSKMNVDIQKLLYGWALLFTILFKWKTWSRVHFMNTDVSFENETSLINFHSPENGIQTSISWTA